MSGFSMVWSRIFNSRSWLSAIARETDHSPSLFWVYVLQNARGGFYVGSTDDVQRRLTEHNEQHGNTYTHKHGPWVLVWSEPHPDRASAVGRERQIKSMKSSRWIRECLLNGRVPTSRD